MRAQSTANMVLLASEILIEACRSCPHHTNYCQLQVSLQRGGLSFDVAGATHHVMIDCTTLRLDPQDLGGADKLTSE